MEQCSFQPKAPCKEDTRPFEDFLMQQEKHIKLKEEKLEQIRNEENKKKETELLEV